ncbi:MAG: DUF4199 domain-containing protein [Flavobacteriales bacterium]
MMFAALTALAVMAFRLILFYAGHPPEGTDFMLVHFLAMVTVVFFTDHRLLTPDLRTPFPDLMREGFKSAALYALLYGVFIWVYYAFVQDAYFAQRVEAMVQSGLAEGQPENVIRPRLTKFFTPFNYASITFFTLLLVGAFDALLVGLLHHKVLRQFRLRV